MNVHKVWEHPLIAWRRLALGREGVTEASWGRGGIKGLCNASLDGVFIFVSLSIGNTALRMMSEILKSSRPNLYLYLLI